MSEAQAERAIKVLAELYADQYGIENPIITVGRETKKTEVETV